MTLVVGLGNRDRRDDGVGPAVAAMVAAEPRHGVRVVEATDPVDLLELWVGEDLVVVVDAVRAADLPEGAVAMLPVCGHQLPPWSGAGGSHAFSLAAAVELARSLQRLPDRVVLVGVRGADFGTGPGLTPHVAAAVGEAAQAVRSLLDAAEEEYHRGSLEGDARR